MGRHSASDAHSIGTPGGVIQVRTVRRLTREQRNDDVSKRAFDNFIDSPRNLSGSKTSLAEQTAHGEKWTLTPGCKGCIWARRGYHHTKACKARKRQFLVTKERSKNCVPPRLTPGENLHVQQNLQVQRDLLDLHAVTPDAEAVRRTSIVAKRSDPAMPTEGVPKRMRIWSKHSRPLTPAPAVVLEQPEKRAKIPTPASVNPETFAMMLEPDGNLETHTELNAVALDLHEPDPETMWSSDLGWVPKSILHEAHEKEFNKLQKFETYEEVPQAEAEGQEIISSRFVDKWEESGELRSRLVSRGYESSYTDPASLVAATPSVVATRIALVLGLAQDVEMAVADISGAFPHAVLEKHFLATPSAEYRKPGVVWKITRYLYGDKRAPRVWQDHFEKTMLELGFGRLESEPGCFVKKGVTHKDTIIVVVHVDDLLSVGKRKHLDNFFVQLENTLILKRIEFIENGKSVLFLGDYNTKFKDKITLKSKDTFVDNMLTMMGTENCKPTNTPMVI